MREVWGDIPLNLKAYSGHKIDKEKKNVEALLQVFHLNSLQSPEILIFHVNSLQSPEILK